MLFENAPEALLDRTDSRDPSTTCRGLTRNGMRCKRRLAARSVSAPTTPQRRGQPDRLPAPVDDLSDESLYCQNHKHQATSLSVRSSPGAGPGPGSGRKTATTTIREERSGLDTLADRLGLLSLAAQESEVAAKTRETVRQRPTGSPRSGKRQQHGQQQQRPALTHPRSGPPKTVNLCFCFQIPLEEASPPSRPRPRPLQPPASTPTPTPTRKTPSREKTTSTPLSPPSPPPYTLPIRNGLSAPAALAGAGAGASPSDTEVYKSLIPGDVSPKTASILFKRLAEPPANDAPGYIYIFMLKPESQPWEPAVAQTARSLLSPQGSSGAAERPRAGRPRVSDVLASCATTTAEQDARLPHHQQQQQQQQQQKHLFLKIGHTSNVQRRLNEHLAQCSYVPELLDYFPRASSSLSSSSAPAGGGGGTAERRMTPHSYQVERLVHAELRGRGLSPQHKPECRGCGRRHQEWFEVEPTRRGVMLVKEVITRWVAFDEAGKL
ncbi:hypothetical protein VTK73DRAFT_1638 [Phialemonium thermophilum]|uniref:Bacteriophage T5 Orf172 DNA-binding domain-containing protein n=1 Tax=Phialemonium thermophilum TaxID=223376 RepID=A0ABR3VT77_9PEZI